MPTGKTVEEEIVRLVTTVLVALSVWKLLCPENFPTDTSNFTAMVDKTYQRIEQLLVGNQLTLSTKQKLMDVVLDRAIKYITAVDKKYPMVYSSLELGSSWFELCLKLLELYKESSHIKDVSGALESITPQLVK